MAQDSKQKISKFFTAEEFRCKGSGILFVDPDLLSMLDSLRDLMGEPVRVTSGCRSPEYNEKLGGAKSSKHITTQLVPCRAADISIPDGNYRYRLVMYAQELGFGGIGIYAKHVHLDVRDRPAMWWAG